MGFVFFLEVRSEKNCLVYKNCGGDISSLFGNSNIVLSHYDVAMTSELNKMDYFLKISVYAEELYVFALAKLV